MDENTPAPIRNDPVISATIWKILLAPLVPLLIAALAAKPAPNAALVFLWLAALAIFIASIWGAVLLGQRIGKTPAAMVGWGVLFFFVLQGFYIGVSFVGCVAVLAAQ
jgi:hypothetical protein